MPLVFADAATSSPDADASPTRRAARKVDPRFAEGEPVKAVGARNRTEAEFIQGLLLEEGIPSMLRRARGFDVPDFLAAGPRDVLVPEAGLSAAREVLLQSELIGADAAQAMPSPSWKLLASVLAAFALVAIVVGLAMLAGI